MPVIDHARFYRYDDLLRLLTEFASENPRYIRLTTIGQSHEKRNIVVVTLTDHETGCAEHKPAFWLDGNIHASELAASAACLYFIEWMAKGIGTNDDITHCLATRAFYICPRINPDGAEWALADSPRIVRSSTRRYPYDEDLHEGLTAEDIDGDGSILEMRIEDPNGPWKSHPEDSRLMVRRDPTDRGGTYYRILPEGRFENFDPDRLIIPGPPEGLDLNRNFPANWRQEHEQQGAGPYPGSEPEVRAMLDFIVAHKNICAGLSFHTFSGVLLRPSSQLPDDKLPPEDLWIYQTMGKKGEAITGYPALSIFQDFSYFPGQTLGGSFDWLYEHHGAFLWVAEIWDPKKAAGIETKDHIGWFRDHDIADDLKMLQWSDRELEGRGYLPWRAFQHPQLGRVELGGWDKSYAFRNPPPKFREQEIARFPAWILWQALILPHLELREVRIEALETNADTGTWRVRLSVENSGWLPTYVTKRAERQHLSRGLIAEIDDAPGVHLVSGKRREVGGELQGWSSLHTAQSFWTPENATSDRHVFEWVVSASLGTSIKVSVTHERAGRVEKTIVLR